MLVARNALSIAGVSGEDREKLTKGLGFKFEETRKKPALECAMVGGGQGWVSIRFQVCRNGIGRRPRGIIPQQKSGNGASEHTDMGTWVASEK